MAASTLSTIENALEQYIREGTVIRQMNRTAVTLNLLEKVSAVGKNNAFDVSVGTGTGTTYTDGQDVASFSDDTELMASLPWGIYGDSFKLTALAESAAASSKTEMARAFVKKLNDAADRAAAKANVDLHTGNGTAPQVHGFNASAGPLSATGTYAGLDRATYPQWASNLNDNGGVGRPVSFTLIDSMLDEIYEASGETPDLITATPTIWRSISNQLRAEGNGRYDIKEFGLRGQAIVLSGGAMALEYDGIPILMEKDLPVVSSLHSMNFYSTKHISVKWMPPADRVRARDLAMIALAGTPDERQRLAGKGPLMARVRRLAASGDYDAIQVVAWLQLECRRPNAQGCLKDLTAS